MYYILLCVWLGNSPWSPLFSRLLDPGVNLDQLASRGPRSNPAVDRCARAIGHGRGPQASNDHMSLMQASHRFWGLGHISTYIYIYISHTNVNIYIYIWYVYTMNMYIYICLLTPVWCLLKHTTWIGVIIGKQWGFFWFPSIPSVPRNTSHLEKNELVIHSKNAKKREICWTSSTGFNMFFFGGDCWYEF